jgi:hypothetical protein
MNNKVEFEPNTPQQIALRFKTGKTVEGRFGDQMYFSLSDGRAMYVDLDVAAKIDQLQLRPSEPFWLCKRWTGKKTDKPTWEAWTDAGEPQAAPAPVPAAPPRRPLPFPHTPAQTSVLERQLEASLEEIRRNKAGAVATAPAPAAAPAAQSPAQSAHAGNGSTGKNGAAPYVPPSAGGSPLVKIPYDVAFRELLKVVTDSLKAAGEQWSDAAKQDALSTLFIQASRDGFLSVWERAK